MGEQAIHLATLVTAYVDRALRVADAALPPNVLEAETDALDDL